MDYKENYKSWLEGSCFDEKTKEELRAISGDDNEIKERFYTELKFGTAGLRGIIGAGTNRMNIYTVRKATQGLADYIISVGARRRELPLLTTPDICHRSLPRKQLSAWLPTALRLMCLNHFALRRSFHLR